MNNNVEYFVNPDKKVVVCKISNIHEMVVRDLNKKGISVPYLIPEISDVIGKAKCSPEDTFDEKTGKRIAYKRAAIKMNKRKLFLMRTMLDEEKKEREYITQCIESLCGKYTDNISQANSDLTAVTKNL